MNNEAAKSAVIDLGFVSGGQYQAHIFADAKDATENPQKLAISIKVVTVNKTLPQQLHGSGGSVYKGEMSIVRN